MMENTECQIDSQVEETKEQIVEWKPLILGCSRLMLWEKPLEAAILFALPTLFFSIIYFLDAGVLTILSLAGLAFVVLDLGLPHLISHLNLAKDATNEDDDVIFERFCHRMVIFKVNCNALCSSLRKFRTDKPPVFYIVISLLLLSLAWIGACINGICIAYLITLGVAFYPGICKHRLVENGVVQVVDTCKNLFAKVRAKATAAANKKKN